MNSSTNRTKLPSALFVLSLLISFGCRTLAAEEAADVSRRPRIGLVLGGGGAKGAAHIGVLRVLEELRIPIDCVAGTSMGALVGGTFAAGRAPEDIERSVRAIDWTETIGGRGQRERMPIDVKIEEQGRANPLEIGIIDGAITTPGGFIATQAIEGQIRSLVADVRGVEDFNRLPIPYRAVATDMVSGEMAILDGGDLARAMRASMAIPGAFSPIIDEQRVLTDGGLMRNLPVDVARDMCADVVIAVWLATPDPNVADVVSALSVVNRSLDVVIRANERAQIATLGVDDVGISVPMGDIGTADFDRTPEAIELGRRAAEANRESLSRYSVSEAEYASWRASLAPRTAQLQTLADVRIDGLERVNAEFVERQLESAVPGATVTPAEIEADIDRVYALGDFERVEYEISGSPQSRTLDILPYEKFWGPDIFRLGIGASTDSDADILGILRIDHSRSWINQRGGRWHNTLQIGGRSILTTDLYQPIDSDHRYFVQPIGYIESNREDLYLDGDRVARFFVRQAYAEIDGGINLGTKAQLRAGLRRGAYKVDLDTGLPILPNLGTRADTSVQLRATYDTRDSIGLPTKGTFLSVRYAHSREWLGGDEQYEIGEGVISQAFSFRGNSLNIIAGGGKKLSGDVAVTEEIQLGGIRSFPGLRPGELRGNGYWYTGATYSWRIVDLQPLFGQALFAGLRIQAGEMKGRYDEVDDGTLYGISGQISGRTPIGPFVLSLGFVDNGSRLLQFTIGRPVPEGSILDELN
jgi:NTE family protein